MNKINSVRMVTYIIVYNLLLKMEFKKLQKLDLLKLKKFVGKNNFSIKELLIQNYYYYCLMVYLLNNLMIRYFLQK